jgi:iron complex outermembrane receptor protein
MYYSNAFARSQLDLWLEGQYPNLVLSMNGFGRRIDNYITLSPMDLDKRLPLSPSTVYRYVNGSAYFWGAEVSLRYRPIDALTLSLQPVYLRRTDERVDEPALGIAPVSVDTGVRYEPPQGRYFVQDTLHAVSSQDRVALTRGETPTDGYVTADIKGGVRLLSCISLQLGVTNLMDAAYVDHLNAKNPFTGQQLPEPGRIVFADVQVRF